MSVAAPNAPASPAGALLETGMRLNRPEFHRRYVAICERNPDFKAELIGGVVYFPEPMSSWQPHAATWLLVSGWLWEYVKRTPGTKAYSAPTVLLDDLGQPEPDAVLKRIEPGEDADGPLVGPQRLVVEVSVSTLPKDLGLKFRDYQRAGVPEYVVIDVDGRRVHWFVRDGNGGFVPLGPDADGRFRSREFPGLWLDVRALFAENPVGLEAAVIAGVAGRDAAPGD